MNYTVTAMVAIQIISVLPIIIGLTYNIVREKAPIVQKLGTTLGGNRSSNMILLIKEMRTGLASPHDPRTRAFIEGELLVQKYRAVLGKAKNRPV